VNLNEVMKCSKCGSTNNDTEIKSDEHACFISLVCECGHEAIVQMIPMPKEAAADMWKMLSDFTPLRLF